MVKNRIEVEKHFQNLKVAKTFRAKSTAILNLVTVRLKENKRIGQFFVL